MGLVCLPFLRESGPYRPLSQGSKSFLISAFPLASFLDANRILLNIWVIAGTRHLKEKKKELKMRKWLSFMSGRSLGSDTVIYEGEKKNRVGFILAIPLWLLHAGSLRQRRRSVTNSSLNCYFYYYHYSFHLNRKKQGKRSLVPTGKKSLPPKTGISNRFTFFTFRNRLP